jgi:hypothetical protein
MGTAASSSLCAGGCAGAALADGAAGSVDVTGGREMVEGGAFEGAQANVTSTRGRRAQRSFMAALGYARRGGTAMRNWWGAERPRSSRSRLGLLGTVAA